MSMEGTEEQVIGIMEVMKMLVEDHKSREEVARDCKVWKEGARDHKAWEELFAEELDQREREKLKFGCDLYSNKWRCCKV